MNYADAPPRPAWMRIGCGDCGANIGEWCIGVDPCPVRAVALPDHADQYIVTIEVRELWTLTVQAGTVEDAQHRAETIRADRHPSMIPATCTTTTVTVLDALRN